MAKAIRFGLAAVLALAVSTPAWADEMDYMPESTSTGSDDVTTDTVDSSSNSAPWEGSGSGEPTNSNDPNAYINDADLREIWSANGGG